VLPAIGPSKQPRWQVTRMSTGSCICLSSWSRLWYSIYLTSNCFGILLYEASNLKHLPQAVQSILTHPLPYSAHLCCSTDSRAHGNAWRWLGYQLAVSWIPRSSCASTLGSSTLCSKNYQLCYSLMLLPILLLIIWHFYFSVEILWFSNYFGKPHE